MIPERSQSYWCFAKVLNLQHALYSALNVSKAAEIRSSPGVVAAAAFANFCMMGVLRDVGSARTPQP